SHSISICSKQRQSGHEISCLTALQERQPRIQPRLIRRPVQDILISAEQPVPRIAAVLLKILRTADKPCYYVLVPETLLEHCHPGGHLGVARASAEERLVILPDHDSFSFGTGRETKSHARAAGTSCDDC